MDNQYTTINNSMYGLKHTNKQVVSDYLDISVWYWSTVSLKNTHFFSSDRGFHNVFDVLVNSLRKIDYLKAQNHFHVECLENRSR